MKVIYKLAITTFSLYLIVIGMFLCTLQTSKQQKNDGLVINLAGRQRMLSQKITKEILLLEANQNESQENISKLSDNIKNTMAVFDMTLTALKDSGKAPISINLKTTKYQIIPKAKGKKLLVFIGHLCDEYGISFIVEGFAKRYGLD